MAERKLIVSIVTPAGSIFNHDQVDLVEARSTTGVIGVLPNHAPIFTKLEHGEVKVRVEGKDKFFTIFQGFLHLNPDNHLIILADTAKRSEELNVEAIRKAKEAAEKALSEKERLSATEILRVETAMQRAIMELKVAERRNQRL